MGISVVIGSFFFFSWFFFFIFFFSNVIVSDLLPQDTIVTAGIWINVECNIGIVSACLPVMRPLLNTAIPKLIRSRFYRSHSSRTGGKGSHRLADEELGTDGTHVGTVDSTAEALGGKLYKQQPPQTGKHKTWLSAAFSSQGGGNGMSLEEEMVPVGKIAIRHDVEWQEGDVVSPIR